MGTQEVIGAGTRTRRLLVQARGGGADGQASRRGRNGGAEPDAGHNAGRAGQARRRPEPCEGNGPGAPDGWSNEQRHSLGAVRWVSD